MERIGQGEILSELPEISTPVRFWPKFLENHTAVNLQRYSRGLTVVYFGKSPCQKFVNALALRSIRRRFASNRRRFPSINLPKSKLNGSLLGGRYLGLYEGLEVGLGGDGGKGGLW